MSTTTASMVLMTKASAVRTVPTTADFAISVTRDSSVSSTPAARNFYFGPHRFDTWGPAVEIDGEPLDDAPPYLPVWPGHDGRPGVAGLDDPGSAPGVDDASELGTPGSDDFLPLTAIKITIRFYDSTSNQIRDLTEVYSLTASP